MKSYRSQKIVELSYRKIENSNLQCKSVGKFMNRSRGRNWVKRRTYIARAKPTLTDFDYVVLVSTAFPEGFFVRVSRARLTAALHKRLGIR